MSHQPHRRLSPHSLRLPAPIRLSPEDPIKINPPVFPHLPHTSHMNPLMEPHILSGNPTHRVLQLFPIAIIPFTHLPILEQKTELIALKTFLLSKNIRPTLRPPSQIQPKLDRQIPRNTQLLAVVNFPIGPQLPPKIHN
ncbi:hypothetical protein NIES46_47830 [Arthrospira platensis NIES-46]|uniref:Uncharacterized protein n=1 Tax=Limnospira platensis NIES-46 TaxID=1236695 RepID=A0A5M3TF17_LIMPL|nr:hypothetical protein NIES46_47830 [Arthrospira platensis NIES-46]